MKKLVLLTSVAAAMLLSAVGCKQNEKEPGTTPDPVLKVNTTIVQATAEGGVYEISYTVENPVEGAVIELTSDAEWVSDPDYSVENVVSVTVAPNDGNADRNANLLLTYIYGEENVLEEEIILHQVYQYDYNTFAQFVEGGFFSGRTVNQPRYAAYISDLGTDESGIFLPGCNVYRLDFYSDVIPSDYSFIDLPEGTYTEDDIDLYNSFWGKVNASGDAWEATVNFTSCTVNVSRDGENTVIEGVLTDEEGKVHHLSYSGIAKLDLYSSDGFLLIDYDIQTVNTFLSKANYIDDNGEVMLITMQLSGTPENEDYTKPFTMLYIDLYAPYDDYKILPGTYTVSSSEEQYTAYPGYVDANMYSCGTHAFYVENGEAILALVSEGTITITENTDGTYVIDCDLLTAEGFSVKSYYEGEVEIPNIPGNCFSTLEDDYTVDLSGVTYPACSYWGDKYGTGGSYYEIEMKGPFEQDPDVPYLKQGTGEEVYIQLVVPASDIESGIPTGKYVAADTYESADPGQYIPGYRNDLGVIKGTRYVGAYEAGFISRCAPAIGGDLNVTNHGDGTYTLQFAFLDDLGNTWDGEWTGELDPMDFSAWLSPEKDMESAVEQTMLHSVANDNLPEQEYSIIRFPSL